MRDSKDSISDSEEAWNFTLLFILITGCSSGFESEIGTSYCISLMEGYMEVGAVSGVSKVESTSFFSETTVALVVPYIGIDSLLFTIFLLRLDFKYFKEPLCDRSELCVRLANVDYLVAVVFVSR